MTVTDHDLIMAFHHGDLFLADLVRDDVELSPQVRQHLADMLLNLLTGRWKRLPKRPKTYGRLIKEHTITDGVKQLEAEGWPRGAAIAKAAEMFGVTTRWVMIAMKADEESTATFEWMEEMAKGLDIEAMEKVGWLAFTLTHEPK